MTTVILVSIGILIAAVAAFMTLFYGGNAFGSSSDKADAARLVGDGVQVEAAVQAFRAQEDRMPGSGSGVDAAAMQELVSKKYLTHVPQGLGKTSSQEWKIDWNYGIARSVVGSAADARVVNICKAARAQLKLPGDVKRCDDGAISSVEPCCIMDAADAT